MKIGDAGYEIIKRYEGFRSSPYLDSVGRATIGWGSTYDQYGKRITMLHPDVTEEEAQHLLERGAKSVERSINRLITIEITQNQFDALASFTYNLGSGNLQASTLRRKLNRGDDLEDVADEFPKWRKAGGVVLAGLVRRRAEEKALFLTG